MTYSSLRALLVKRFHIPKERLVRKTMRHFTLAEKAIFYFFVTLFILSGISLLNQVNNAFLVEVPLRGGSITEGVVGNPRFINPVLAFTEADKNLTALIYSGLVRMDTKGNPINDLAESVNISADGLTYTAHIRSDAVFQDGVKVTSDDIDFTIQKIENISIKSPLFGNWNGVAVSKPDENTIVFTLKKPFAAFMDNLTLGILPKHIWKNVTDEEFSFSQFNSLSIGSGPYKINSVERNSGGIPDYYDLVPFEKVVGQEPFVSHLIFRFYPSQADLLNGYNNGDIQNVSGFSPEETSLLKNSNATIFSSPLPRIFAVFFNQNQSQVLLDKAVRQALDLTAPREEIVKDVFHGYATAIQSPLPPGLFDWSAYNPQIASIDDRIAQAQSILAKAGWTKNTQTGLLEKKSKKDTMTLTFSISTGDAPELKAVAQKLQTNWAKLGAKVDILVFESGDLNQNVIRPRKFDALLFGEIVGRDALMYPFWHSSERNDPGLNVALYANPKVDKLLEDARSTTSNSQRESDYKSFNKEIQNDEPAVFLYAPSFLYMVPKDVKAVTLGELSSSQDRFLGIRNWYIETNNVWKIFVNN